MDERRGETMQIEKIYDSVIHLDEEEQIGYAYYQETGEYLDYPLLLYLKSSPIHMIFRSWIRKPLLSTKRI